MDDGCRCPYSLANPASGFAEDLEQTLRHRGADSWQLGPMVFLLFLKKGTLLVTCSRILYRGEKQLNFDVDLKAIPWRINVKN